MSVASLILEERSAGAWLAVHKVVGGPMVLVASVQHLAPLLSTVLTPEQPGVHIQHRHAGVVFLHLMLQACQGCSDSSLPLRPGPRSDSVSVDRARSGPGGNSGPRMCPPGATCLLVTHRCPRPGGHAPTPGPGQVAGPVMGWGRAQTLPPGPLSSKTSLWRCSPQPHFIPGLEVRSLRLEEAGPRDYVFTMPGGHPEGPGHILIPAGEVRRLCGKGLAGVTMIHSWFTSSILLYTLGESGLERQAPTSTGQASAVQRSQSTQVGSAVISSEVRDAAGEVSTAVTFHLQHQAQASPQRLVEPVCAFWNFSPGQDAGGSWATRGCSVTALYPDSTACFCNHSTSFAVLLQVWDAQRGPEEDSLLRTVSFVGCGVSFCALTTSFLLFLAAGVPTSERTTVHKNLTFSLASAEGFLMASEWAQASQVACVAVTAAMHFLFLVAFSWMLVEGLLLWSKVVAVSMRPGSRMRFYYALGWGAPVLIVAVTLAVSPHDYVAAGHCWLSVHTDAIWAFVGPVLFVLAANTCILVRVVLVTVSSARRRAHTLNPQPCLQQRLQIQIWATVKPVLVLLPVLGLTWVVGTLVHLSPAWAYAAVGLNSIQGPYIFLIYSAYNGEVRSALQRMMGKKAAAEALAVRPGEARGARGPPRPPTLSFQPCCSPSGQGPSPPMGSPLAWAPPRRQVALRGTRGPRIPTAFSSIAEPERPAVELTAFKASGSAGTSKGPSSLGAWTPRLPH
nr:adhesion G-protein coupled receptor D2 isoform X1 [Oryctolagus cuniculus]XP_051695284.1 adhesion G-protein coupled receptor D2 isoform X1 [Oryctolagus cuniculus]